MPDEMDIERRAIPAEIEIREQGNGPVITGYAAVFNQPSEIIPPGFRERIVPGAFKDAIAGGADVRALWQHDPSYVLGRTTNGTLTLAEDAKGLRVEISPPDTGWAKDAITSLRRGDVNQMSFGFVVGSDGVEWNRSGQIQERTVTRVARLVDVSPVTFPAYPTTTAQVRAQVESMRAQEETTPDTENADDWRAPVLRQRIKILEMER